LKFCANVAFPIAHHLHLLHLNQTRNCSELKNLHFDGVVWRNCCFQIPFISCQVRHLWVRLSIRFRSGLVDANFKFMKCSLKISLVNVWSVISADQYGAVEWTFPDSAPDVELVDPCATRNMQITYFRALTWVFSLMSRRKWMTTALWTVMTRQALMKQTMVEDNVWSRFIQSELRHNIEMSLYSLPFDDEMLQHTLPVNCYGCMKQCHFAVIRSGFSPIVSLLETQKRYSQYYESFATFFMPSKHLKPWIDRIFSFSPRW
jgi:hypothetical protein